MLLLNLDFFQLLFQMDPWNANTISPPPLPKPDSDPWRPPSTNTTPKSADPWSPRATPLATSAAAAAKSDPWSPVSQGSSTDLDDFDIITNRNRTSPKMNGAHSSNNNTPDPFELHLLGNSLPPSGPSPSTGATKKTPQSFLGDNAGLVNLDNLVTPSSKCKLSTLLFFVIVLGTMPLRICMYLC